MLLLTFVLLKYLCPIFWLWTDVVSPPVVVKIDEERGMRVSVSSVACCCAASRVTETLTLHELSRCTVRVFSQHMTMMVEELHTDAGCFEVVATGGLVREVRALSDVGETWLNLAHVLSQPGTICCGGALIYGRIFCGLELPRSLTSKGQQVLGVDGPCHVVMLTRPVTSRRLAAEVFRLHARLDAALAALRDVPMRLGGPVPLVQGEVVARATEVAVGEAVVAATGRSEEEAAAAAEEEAAEAVPVAAEPVAAEPVAAEAVPVAAEPTSEPVTAAAVGGTAGSRAEDEGDLEAARPEPG